MFKDTKKEPLIIASTSLKAFTNQTQKEKRYIFTLASPLSNEVLHLQSWVFSLMGWQSTELHSWKNTKYLFYPFSGFTNMVVTHMYRTNCSIINYNIHTNSYALVLGKRATCSLVLTIYSGPRYIQT